MISYRLGPLSVIWDKPVGGIYLHQHVIVTSVHFREIADHKNQWIRSLLLPFKETSHSSFLKWHMKNLIEWSRLISVDFQYMILDKYFIVDLRSASLRNPWNKDIPVISYRCMKYYDWKTLQSSIHFKKESILFCKSLLVRQLDKSVRVLVGRPSVV